jgi:hypothetical protein
MKARLVMLLVFAFCAPCAAGVANGAAPVAAATPIRTGVQLERYLKTIPRAIAPVAATGRSKKEISR